MVSFTLADPVGAVVHSRFNRLKAKKTKRLSKVTQQVNIGLFIFYWQSAKLWLLTGWWIHNVNWSVWLYVGKNSMQRQFLTCRCLLSLSWGSGYCWEAGGLGDSGGWRGSTAWRDGFRTHLEQWIDHRAVEKPPSAMMGLRNRESVEVALLEKREGYWKMSCLLFPPRFEFRINYVTTIMPLQVISGNEMD